MKTLKNFVKIIFDIFFLLTLLVLFLVLYNFIQTKVSDKSYSEIFGYTFFEVITGSMKDTIMENDIVIVKITKEVHENDIISYEENGDIITHRIVKENGPELITKGDANNSVDNEIDKSCVIGKVVKIIHGLGIWLKVFTDIKVIASIFITICLFELALREEKNNKKHRHSFSKGINNLKGIIKDAREKKKTKD